MRERIPVTLVVVATAVAAFAALALAATPKYEPPVTYTAGDDAFPVAVADFNGDGKLDVATGNENDDDVSILLGKGNAGKFKEKGDFPAADYPFGIAAKDFNKDGDDDLAVVGYDGDEIGVLTSKGNGSFKAPVSYPVPDGPYSVAAADLNGDRRVDLAVASDDDPKMSVLLGKKGGKFKPAESYPAGQAPTSVAIAQLDGKSGKDIAVLDYEKGLKLFRGNGKGDFKKAVSIKIDDLQAAYGMAVAQIDGKGRPDIWVARCADSPQNLLLRAKGETGLGYKKPVKEKGGSCPYEIEIKDVDGNGYKDPILTSEDNGKVSVLYNGKKGLKSPKNYPAVAEAYSVASGDFNRDGIRDFAVPDYSNSKTAIVLSK
ncbi:MAG: VCBS repeat-containing protein [Solirubrobacterales bacterium]